MANGANSNAKQPNGSNSTANKPNSNAKQPNGPNSKANQPNMGNNLNNAQRQSLRNAVQSSPNVNTYLKKWKEITAPPVPAIILHQKISGLDFILL